MAPGTGTGTRKRHQHQEPAPAVPVLCRYSAGVSTWLGPVSSGLGPVSPGLGPVSRGPGDQGTRGTGIDLEWLAPLKIHITSNVCYVCTIDSMKKWHKEALLRIYKSHFQLKYHWLQNLCRWSHLNVYRLLTCNGPRDMCIWIFAWRSANLYAQESSFKACRA